MNTLLRTLLTLIAIATSSATSRAAELWSYQFVPNGSRPFNVSCGECGPPFLGAHADIAGTFTILLDWQNLTGRLVELNDHLVNVEEFLLSTSGTGTTTQLADPRAWNHGIIPPYSSLNQTTGDFTFENFTWRLLSDGSELLPTGFSRRGEPYDIRFNLQNAKLSMRAGAIDWVITVTDAPATFLRAEIAGDYNGDLIVNAADYVAWRKNGGAATGYEYWRESFTSPPAGSGSHSTPEPSMLVLIALSACLPFRRRPVRRSARVSRPRR